jgi:hypothetical protein
MYFHQNVATTNIYSSKTNLFTTIYYFKKLPLFWLQFGMLGSLRSAIMTLGFDSSIALIEHAH